MSEKPVLTITVNDASETRIVGGPQPPATPNAKATAAASEKEE